MPIQIINKGTAEIPLRLTIIAVRYITHVFKCWVLPALNSSLVICSHLQTPDILLWDITAYPREYQNLKNLPNLALPVSISQYLDIVMLRYKNCNLLDVLGGKDEIFI